LDYTSNVSGGIATPNTEFGNVSRTGVFSIDAQSSVSNGKRRKRRGRGNSGVAGIWYSHVEGGVCVGVLCKWRARAQTTDKQNKQQTTNKQITNRQQTTFDTNTTSW
jgi:predicted DNA-binding helix-hairpin-helix protein